MSPLLTNAAIVTPISQAPFQFPIVGTFPRYSGPIPIAPDLNPAHYSSPAVSPVIALSAAVVSTPGINLSLLWNPSPDTTVVSQNLYSGPASGNYTKAIGFSDNTTHAYTVSNLTARTWFVVSAVDQNGDEAFSGEIFWPPYTNIFLITGATNMASTLTGPWTAVTGDLALTNPPGTAFFRGNPAKMTYLVQ